MIILFYLIIFVLIIQVFLIRFVFKKISFQKIIINSTLIIGFLSFLFFAIYDKLDIAVYFLFNFYLIMFSIFNIINMSQTSSRINMMILIQENKIKKVKDIKKFYKLNNFFENRIKRLIKLNWIKKVNNDTYTIKTFVPFLFLLLFKILRKILFLKN